VDLVANEQTPKAVSEAVGVCPRTSASGLIAIAVQDWRDYRIAPPGRIDYADRHLSRPSSASNLCAASVGPASKSTPKPASRLPHCFSRVMKDKRRATAIAFLQAAVVSYASLGVEIERVMTEVQSFRQSLQKARPQAHLHQTLHAKDEWKGRALHPDKLALASGPVPGLTTLQTNAPPTCRDGFIRYNWHRPHGSIGSCHPSADSVWPGAPGLFLSAQGRGGNRPIMSSAPDITYFPVQRGFLHLVGIMDNARANFNADRGSQLTSFASPECSRTRRARSPWTGEEA
jgi:hypothetical protein